MILANLFVSTPLVGWSSKTSLRFLSFSLHFSLSLFLFSFLLFAFSSFLLSPFLFQKAKVNIMEKLEHHDAEVQKEALLAIQKLMVSNWEFLPQN